MRGVGRQRMLRLGVVAAIASAVAFAAPAAAGADGGGGGGRRDVTVMTQNLYLGSSLDAALVPGITGPEFVAAVAKIYGTVLVTNFPLRAQTIADEVKAERPDLIGLQEVSNWIAEPTHAGPVPVSLDFLQILLDALKSRGLNYEAVVTADHASIGPVPLVAPQVGCGATATDCEVTFQDRDVILRNKDTLGLDVTATKTGNFPTQATVQVLGQPLSFARGWAYLDGTFGGSRFRFVTTHLEVANPPQFGQIQEQQARELVAGPLKTLRPVILTGDLNSAADSRPGDPGFTDSYFTILKALFVDAWWTNLHKPGFTCCQLELLNNPTSTLHERIDFVLTRLALPTSAHLDLGEIPTSPLPHWASDHAGLIATVHLF
jgi:endonuclease/exonuclease/phosphatase family metal-dependent hydrolase